MAREYAPQREYAPVKEKAAPEPIYSPEEVRPEPGYEPEPGITFRPKEIGRAAYLSTKQQFPAMEKGFALTPMQAYMGMVTSPKQLGKRVATAQQEEAKIEKQLEKIPLSERIAGAVVAPFGEAAAFKAGATGLQALPKLGQALGVDKMSLIPKSFKLGAQAKEQTAALQQRLGKQAGAEAETAAEKATLAEQRAGAAETTAQKQARQQELASRGLPGVRTAEEAGRFKPIAQTNDEIGNQIRQTVDANYERLKAIRAANAKKNKAESFSFARQREFMGEKIADTKAYNNVLKDIDKLLVDPTTKLTVASLDATKNPLLQIRRAIDPRYQDPATGVVIGRPISFQGLEDLRRFLGDRAAGLPAEGFDAINQIKAGDLAKSITKVMEEFSPGVRKFIDQYRKDSEPLKVFQTKVGKALVDEQLIGKGANYRQVPSQSIPDKVFSNPEAYKALVETLGGNTQQASAQARRYFASQLEGKATAKDVENFIRKNRAVLKETGSLRDAEQYAINLRTTEKRGTAATEIGKSEVKTAEQQRRLVDKYRTLESNLAVARDADSVVSLGDSFAKGMLDDGLINQQQYRQLRVEINDIATKIKNAEEAKNRVKIAAYKAAGYGAAGTGAAYGVGKLLD